MVDKGYKDYFNSEIQERKAMSKKPSKYIAVFDYFDQTLIVLSVTIGGISIISFTSVTRIPAGIASASFYFNIFSDYRNDKEIIEDKQETKSRNKMRLLCLLKAN